MALSIYKSGQGYWTRMLSAIGAGVLLASGLVWAWAELEGVIVDDSTRSTVQAVVAIAIGLGGGGILFWVLNKPRIVDFMIATESEMRKVNWPTQRELVGSTWVVICGTALIAIFLTLINIGFFRLFNIIGILDAGG